MASRHYENKHFAFHSQIIIATVSTYLWQGTVWMLARIKLVMAQNGYPASYY